MTARKLAEQHKAELEQIRAEYDAKLAERDKEIATLRRQVEGLYQRLFQSGHPPV